MVFGRGKRQQAVDEPPEMVRVGRKLAIEDGLAFQAAQEAVGDWLRQFPAIANAAGESDGGATRPARMLIEAFSAASALREAIANDDSVEAVFNEQAFISREHVDMGVTKEWTVAFLQLRCIAIGYMYGLLGMQAECQEVGRRFAELAPPE